MQTGSQRLENYAPAADRPVFFGERLKIVTGLDFQNMTVEELKRLSNLNQRSLISAQMVIAIVPILMLYLFLQKYFVTGIVLGSVKR